MFLNKDGKEIERTPCQVYTRVMGYLRPVSHYNIGKKSEFYSRVWFTEAAANASNNQRFTEKYGSSPTK